ncbi:MAG TPA: PilW family protein [Burkholderiales bacterium]|nr:PilW family protein [Burkholderiales bacterium]
MTRTRRTQAGLSLIELMISITIGMVVLAAVALVFVNTSRARAEIERTSRQIENGRYAIELLSDDLRLAGFYGELNTSTLAVPGWTMGTTNQCSTTVTDWKSWIPLHVMGFASGVGFVQGTPASCALDSHKAGTDILLVRRVRTCYEGTSTPAASTDCGDASVSASKPYLQVSLCSSDSDSYNMAVGASGLTLKKKNCTATAGVRQYYVNVYYISTNNGHGVNVPTLKRLSLDGSSWTTTPLVEGIEEFHLEYGLDTTGDGGVDSYTATPADATAWSNVMAVKIWILARNIEESAEAITNKDYVLGSATTTTYSPTDKYRRHVYSTLVRLVNPAGRRETP